MGEPSDAERSDTRRSDTARSAAFGALLRSHRLGRGLTQEELAERAGLSVRSIGDLERGRAIPHRRTIGLLAEALDLAGAAAEQFRAAARAAWVRHAHGAPEPETAAGPRPAQLPHGPSDFVGRGVELAALREFRAAHRLRNAVGMCVLEGPAGVGKSALAVHFARSIADEFPDGQLFADLRGFDPHQPPLPPAAVLGRFLRGLGFDTRRTFADPDELTSLFRSALADKRLLIVLDNAASTDDEVLNCAPLALAITRETANQRTEAFTLCHLGRAVAATATFEEAEPYLLEALRLGRSADDRHVQAWALDYLGRAALTAGRRAQAAEHWAASATLFTALRDPQAADVNERLAALPS